VTGRDLLELWTLIELRDLADTQVAGQSDTVDRVVKLQLAEELAEAMHVGDELELVMQRVLGDEATAHWLPLDCTAYTPAATTSSAVDTSFASAEHLQKAMRQAQAIDDPLAFAGAYAQWQRAVRVEQLVAQGELAALGAARTIAGHPSAARKAATHPPPLLPLLAAHDDVPAMGTVSLDEASDLWLLA
jgi:hypothetical protein